MISSEIVEITDPILLGETPKVKMYTSLEGANPGGSIKDHMVYNELTESLRSGQLKPGDLVSEISAGSTALSLAYHTRQLGLRFMVFLPHDVPAELVSKLQSLGTQIQFVEVKTAFVKYKAFLESGQSWDFNQTFDKSKRRHYKALGRKIEQQVGPIDLLIGAVGTGHSILGIQSGFASPPQLITAEPSPWDKISGVRNMTTDSLGEKDPCQPQYFHQRMIFGRQKFLPLETLQTSCGAIAFSDSFHLVLAAANSLSQSTTECKNLFLVGAKNKAF